jgi:hypothetical protein
MFCVIVTAMIVTFVVGGFHMIYEGDPTTLSWWMMAICGYMTIRCGLFCHEYQKWTKESYKELDLLPQDINGMRRAIHIKKGQKLRIASSVGWFSAMLCSRIGLVGTVIGFIWMLAAVSGIDMSNPDVAGKAMFAALTTGGSVALYTTLIGQICNITLSVQFYNLKQALDTRLLKLGVDNHDS